MWRKQKQDGLASIVVVFILIVVLSLISIGFTKIINRGTQSSVSSQLAAAATAAAQSGITQTAQLIKNNAALPSGSDTNCNAFLVTGGGINRSFGATANTNFSCILADKTPSSLQYQNLPAYKSQVVKLQQDTGQSATTKLMFSWQSSDRTKNVMLPPGHSLYDETYWSNNKYSPVLSVSLYPIFSPDSNLSNTKSNTKTFFLYPENGSTGTMATLSYNAASGLQGVDCNAKGTNGVFNGTADYDCNAVITNLPASAVYYYARIAPVYNQTDVKIKANSSSETTKFKDAQAQIDVTANSGGASKRLQARVNIGTAVNPTDDAIPESALRSAGTLCKRLVVTSTVALDSNTSAADCGLNLPTPPALDLTFTAIPPGPLTAGQSTTLRWTATPTVSATSCSATAGPWPGGLGPRGNDSSQIAGPLAAGTYTYELTCSNSGTVPTSVKKMVQVVVNAAPALDLTFTAIPPGPLTAGQSTTLRWTATPTVSATSCSATAGPWPGGLGPRGNDSSQIAGPLAAGTYTYELTCSNSGTVPTSVKKTVQVVVNAAPQTVSLTAFPTKAITGSSTALTWSLSNTASCTASSNMPAGNWSSGKSGNANTGALTTDQTYSLTCTGLDGSKITKTAQFTVIRYCIQGHGNNPDIYNYHTPAPWPNFLPCIDTNKTANITSTSATLRGSVRPHGYKTATWWEVQGAADPAANPIYGPDGHNGTSDPPDGDPTDIIHSVDLNINNLSANRTYSYRLCGDNHLNKSGTVIDSGPGKDCYDWRTFSTPSGGSGGCTNGATNYPDCTICPSGWHMESGVCVQNNPTPGHDPVTIDWFNLVSNGYANLYLFYHYPRCYSPGNWWDGDWRCRGSDPNWTPPTWLTTFDKDSGYVNQNGLNTCAGDWNRFRPGTHAWRVCGFTYQASAGNDTNLITCTINANSNYGQFYSGGRSGTTGSYGWTGNGVDFSEPNPFTLSCTTGFNSNSKPTYFPTDRGGF